MAIERTTPTDPGVSDNAVFDHQIFLSKYCDSHVEKKAKLLSADHQQSQCNKWLMDGHFCLDRDFGDDQH